MHLKSAQWCVAPSYMLIVTCYKISTKRYLKVWWILHEKLCQGLWFTLTSWTELKSHSPLKLTPCMLPQIIVMRPPDLWLNGRGCNNNKYMSNVFHCWSTNNIFVFILLHLYLIYLLHLLRYFRPCTNLLKL